MSKAPRFSNRIQKQTLAEQVALTLEEAVLEGEWGVGEALPPEPELAQSFGVSRAVVRDATRMLAARGLVQAHHGRGVFVTESQAEAFGSALLLALRRNEATVWDVEQFEQMVFPQVCALASTAATDADRSEVKALGEAYIEIFSQSLRASWHEEDAQEEDWEPNHEAFIAFIHAVFDATHNKVWQLLAGPLLRLRSLRHWDDSDIELDMAIKFERAFVDTVVAALAADNPQEAQQMVAKLMLLPAKAEEAMKKTAVGEIPIISVSREWNRA